MRAASAERPTGTMRSVHWTASANDTNPFTERSEPSKPSSPTAPDTRKLLHLDLTTRRKHTQRDGQIEPGTDLAEIAGREVDGDPIRRPLQARREDGGPYPIARLTTGRVGQADNGESRKTVPGVDLNRDRMTIDTRNDR